jgi:hypothetical protein
MTPEWEGKRWGETFIHEMTHVWQVHNTRMGLSWITDALVSQTFNSLLGDAYDYDAGKSFGDYNLEQQGDIVADWYAAGWVPNPSPTPGSPWIWVEAVTSPLYTYIEGNIRVGNPG